MDISQLPISQLNDVKKQLEGEVDQFQNSITSLKYAQARYEESSEALSAITGPNEGGLSASHCVPFHP